MGGRGAAYEGYGEASGRAQEAGTGSRRWYNRARDRRYRNAGRSWGGFEDGCSGDPCAEGNVVIGPTGAVKVMVATKPVDFRKGAEAGGVRARRDGRGSVLGRSYVFRAKRADRIKLVYFDGTGACLFAKRLEDGKFCWPGVTDGVVRLTAAQLQAMLEGLDWRRVHETRETRVPIAAS